MNVAKAWKNPLYRASLSVQQRDSLPENPVGEMVIPDDALDTVNGGSTIPCTGPYTVVACNTVADTVCQGSCGSWSVGCC